MRQPANLSLPSEMPCGWRRPRRWPLASPKGLPSSRKFANPDVPEAHGLALVAVSLKLDGRSVVLFVEGLAYIQSLALQLEVILDQHAVQQDRCVGWSLHGTIVVKRGRCPDHVVGLPLSRLTARVCEWNRLLVNAADHPVHIGRVVVAVEDLQFVAIVSRAGR